MKRISSPNCKDCLCNETSVFVNLTPEQHEILAENKTCNVYKRGTTVFLEGNRIYHFYCINSGIVKMFKTGSEGKEQIVTFAKSGNIIGYRSILSREVACTTAEAIDDCTICAIPGEILFELVEKNGKFAVEMLKLACNELGEANQFLTDIAQKSVRERLAEVLIKLKDSFNTDAEGYLQVSLTREEVASLAGTATESVIRLLSEFKSDKYIELDGRRIKILNEEKLRKLSNYF
jgi:CRP/FNR family transcriptional regulator, polysaccharide utilization system transcription regulator